VNTSGDERPCRIISLSEYNQFVEKSASGQIVSVCINPGLDNSTLYVWPVNTSVTDVLRFRYKNPIADLLDDGDSLEMPVDCLMAVIDHLTARFSHKYTIPLNERIYWEQKAKDSWGDIDDIEKNTSFFFQPDRR
jgi:hypothetical protein